MQKEIALYTASKITSEFSWFDIDADIDPLFKVIEDEDFFMCLICLSFFCLFPLATSCFSSEQRSFLSSLKCAAIVKFGILIAIGILKDV